MTVLAHLLTIPAALFERLLTPFVALVRIGDDALEDLEEES